MSGTPKRNQPGMLARFKTGKGLLPRRSKFLDATWYTFFGPGHRPNMKISYKPPTEWPEAGTLRRVPQVVWLQSRLIQAELAMDGFSDVGFTNTWKVYRPWRGPDDTPPLLISGQPYVFLSGPHTQFQPNLARAETDRLVSLFNQVKEEIEGKRRNRTWIEVIDWFDHRTGGTVEFDRANYGTNGFSILAAPKVTLSGGDPNPDFFGTDFLNIYAGNLFRPDTDFFNYIPASLMVEDSRWKGPYGILKATAPLFVRHATRLYSNQLPWDHWTLFDDRGSNYIDFGPSFWDNSQFLDYGDQTSSVFDEAASVAAGDEIDLTHEGDTSGLTADSLKRLIADHFRFDPDTGDDLPPG